LATTWMKPLHINKGKTIAQTITDRTDYAQNPDKTWQYKYVTGYECAPRTADVEFLLSKQQYADITGRNQGKHDILAYHMRQAFRPGEITPEEANRLGHELAQRFTKGKHAYIVATHIDKKHVHNHIVFNSTALDSTHKFVNFLGSSWAIRRLSDHICLENGLSVIKDPKPSRGHYGTWLGDKKEPSWRERLTTAIDTALENKPVDFDTFLKQLEKADVEIKRRGDTLSLRMKTRNAQGKEQKRFIQFCSLPNDYKENAVRERIDGKRVLQKKAKPTATPSKNVSLLIDIQNSIKAQNSPGYERWAKIFNLKQAAQTLLFLQDNDITEFDILHDKAQKAKDDFNNISVGINTADSRMKEISALQKHIGTYSKTKDIFVAYRKTKYSKKYFAEHEQAITFHKAAKKYFNELGLEKLPTIKSLQTEYATLSAEKKKLYSQYHSARKFMQEILTAKQNAEQLLTYRSTAKEKENER
jgi:Relaxase/Mobilisation nuclease domain.